MAVRKLEAELDLDSSGFVKGMGEAVKSASALGSAFGTLAGNLASKAISEFYNDVVGAVTGLRDLAIEVAAYSEKINNMQKTTGLSRDMLQSLGKAADESGTSLQAMVRAVTKLEVAAGTNSKAFQQLGISMQFIKNASPEQVLNKVFEVTSKLSSVTERNAMLQKLLGKSYTETLPAFQAYLAGVDRYVNLSDEQIAANVELDDSLDSLSTAWDDLKKQIGSALNTPEVRAAITALADAVRDMARAAKDGEGPIAAFFKAIAEGSVNAGKWVTFLAGAMDGLKERMASATKDTPGAIQRGLEALEKFENKLDAAKLKSEGKKMFPGLFAGLEEGTGGGGKRLSDPKADAKALAARNKVLKEHYAIMQDMVGGPLEDWASLNKYITSDMERQEESWDKTLAAAKEVAAFAIKGGRLRAGDMMESIGGKGLWTKDPQVIADEMERTGAAVRNAKDAEVAARNEAAAWQGLLQGVALVAGSLGGIFGDVLNVVGNIGQSFKDWGKMTGPERFNAVAGGIGQIGGLIGQKYKKTGGALQGAAGGAMAGMAIGGPVGAAIGGLAGGVLGFLGGRKKDKEEKAAQEKAFKDLTDQLKSQYGSLQQLDQIATKYGVSLKKALASKDAEKLNKELAELQKRQQGLAQAGSGIVALIQSFKPATEAGAMAQAGLFSTVFWATVQREGLAVAAETMQPAFDKLMEGASESMKAFLAPIGQQMALAGDEAFKSASAGATALGDAIHGMMDAGIVSINDLKNAGVVAMEEYNSALAAANAQGLEGAAAQEAAIRAVGPAVTELLAAYTTLGIPLDENAAALQAAAEATGMMFPQDSMTRAAEAMERVAGALEKAFGLSAGIASNIGNVHFPEVPSSYYGGGGNYSVPGGTNAGPADSAGPQQGIRQGEYNPNQDFDSNPHHWESFAAGSGGYRNFGTGTPAMLHGVEKVVRPGDEKHASVMIAPTMVGDPLLSNAGRKELSAFQVQQIVREMRNDPYLRRLLREDGGR